MSGTEQLYVVARTRIDVDEDNEYDIQYFRFRARKPAMRFIDRELKDELKFATSYKRAFGGRMSSSVQLSLDCKEGTGSVIVDGHETRYEIMKRYKNGEMKRDIEQ